MTDILQQIAYAIVDPDEHEEAIEKELFERMANFLLTLDPDQLNDDQLGETIDILTELEPESFDTDSLMNFNILQEADEDEPSEEEKEYKREYYHKNKRKGKRLYPKADKTALGDRFKNRVYKRKKRRKIALQKRKLIRSAEGKRRIRTKDRLERVHKTPTLRRKIRYNPMRKKRAKNRDTTIVTPQGNE